MLRRRLTTAVVVLALLGLTLAIGATYGAVQDSRQAILRDGLSAQDAYDELLGRVGRASLISGVFALAAVGVAAWYVVGRQLRQLGELTDAVVDLGSGDLSRRAPEPSTSEVGRLAVAFNTMAGRLEAELSARREAEEDLRRFLADASHELRTPIATIRGYAELFRLAAGTDPEGAVVAAARIEAEAGRVGVLVQDLLDLSTHGVSGREPVDLYELAATAVRDARAREPGRRWDLRGQPVLVEADADRLRRVVDNLLQNISQHTPAATSAVVTVAVERTATGTLAAGRQWACVRVADDGPGMCREDAARAFERFFRGRAGSAAGQRGSGLGLAIVAAVVRDHGGEASIDAAPDAGFAVTLRLPAAGRPEAPARHA